jgi:hypothetical protein
MSFFSRSPVESSPGSKSGGHGFAPVFLIFMALAMLISGGWVITESLVMPMLDGARMRHWIAVPGVLDDISLRASNGEEIPVLGGPGVSPELKQSWMPSGIVKLKVKYHYYVGDQSYDGRRYGLHLSLDDGDAQRYAAARMYRKQEVSVWVNPDNPAESVLDRSLHWGVLMIAIPAAAIALVGLVILFAGVKTWWQLRTLARRSQALRSSR